MSQDASPSNHGNSADYKEAGGELQHMFSLRAIWQKFGRKSTASFLLFTTVC